MASQLFNSVDAKQYKRPDIRGPEAGFASNDFRNEVEELTGSAGWSDGTPSSGLPARRKPGP